MRHRSNNQHQRFDNWSSHFDGLRHRFGHQCCWSDHRRQHSSGDQNQFADELATLTSMVEIPKEIWTCPLEIEQKYQKNKKMIHEENRGHDFAWNATACNWVYHHSSQNRSITFKLHEPLWTPTNSLSIRNKQRFFLDESFLLACNYTFRNHKLFLGRNVVLSISLDGELTVSTGVTIKCYDQFGVNESHTV